MRLLAWVLVLSVSISITSQCTADELEYEYLQFDVALSDLDTPQRSLNGVKYQLDYSDEFLDSYYLRAGFTQSRYDNVSFYDIVQNRFSAGIGVYHSLSWRSHLYGEVSYNAIFSDLAAGDQSDTGISLKIGLRMLPIEAIEEFEVEFAGGHGTAKDAVSGEEDTTFGIVNARWNINRWLSVSIGSQLSSDQHIWRSGFRVSF